MKNNKGFTLIELLAVIIILTVIAVITVPRILGVMEEAQQGIAKESAYGYKKAIDKYFYQKTMNKEEIELKGAYQVNSNGELFNDENTYQIEMDGTPPKNGVLSYVENELTTGCLTINKYKVIFENGEVKGIEQGNCDVDNEIEIASCIANNPHSSPEEWFEINEKTNTITGFSEEKGENVTNITIPCTINGVRVTNIGLKAFQNQNLTSISIPSTVTNIESNSFENNKLTSITIPDTVTTIGSHAFENNLLTDITISKNITEIPTSAFQNNKLTNITIPNKVIKIGSYAFADNLLTSISIPSSVTEIGTRAFKSNQLKTLTIPDTVQNISIAAFNDNLLSNDEAYIYARNNGVTDTTTLISYGGENKNIEIPNNVITLDSYSLSETNLESITIPNTVTHIKNNAFYINNLTNIIIPESVTTIDSQAFLHNLLTTVTIPDTVQNIGPAAFNDNRLPNENAYIYARNNGISDTTKLISYGGENNNVVIPNNIITIEKNAFAWSDLETITFSENITTIGESAFYTNKLTNITIPSNVTTIGTSAFSNNELTTIKLEGGEKNINSMAFIKNTSSNQNLTTIYNNTNTAYNWFNILTMQSTSSSTYTFITGTFAHELGDITITTSSS